jgi:hypothetical protein
MIKFELFSLNCMSDNFSWKDKTITIKHNIEYILISLEHYNFIESKCTILNNAIQNNAKQDNTIQEFILPFTYSDLTKFWLNNIKKYSDIFNIDFIKLKIGIDYSLAPLYLSNYVSKNNNFIVIGIFLLNYKYKMNDNSKITSIKHNFLSRVKSLPNTRKCDINKYNIISGILNYQNLFVDINNNYKIPLKTILTNACNYLPKLDIIIKYNESLKGCFKVS